jgi:hypothetical protein
VRNFKRLICLCFGALLLQSCGTEPPSAPKPNVSNANTAPVVLDQVAYADTNKFDSLLSDSLDETPPNIKITSETPMSPNAIPPRLEKWFSAVVKSGGTVKLQKVAPPPPPGEAATRGFLFEIIDLVFTLYEIVNEMVLYAPAEKYNVVVTYNGSEIQDINFRMRNPNP